MKSCIIPNGRSSRGNAMAWIAVILISGIVLSGKVYADSQPKAGKTTVQSNRPTATGEPKLIKLGFPSPDGIHRIENPDPQNLPSISISLFDYYNVAVMVGVKFPNVPGLVCEAWCFECNPGALRVDFLGVRPLGGGKLELLHRFADAPAFTHVTTITPGKGWVEFVGRIEGDKGNSQPLALPARLQVPDMCCQFKRAPNFQSAPENEYRGQAEHAVAYYNNFIKRCFIFTSDGLTTFDKTHRRGFGPEHGYKFDDPRATTDTVSTQDYYGVWQPDPKTPGVCATRYTVPLMGVISRDGQYLAAVAGDSPNRLSQLWMDCIHLYGQWLPESAPLVERTWRCKIYGMKNNPKALLDRVAKDFPEAMKLKEKQVP